MALLGFILGIFMVCLCPGDSRFIKDAKWDVTQQSLTPGTCSKCIRILDLLTDAASGRDAQEATREPLHTLCRRLPGERASECDSHVKTYLPKVLRYPAGHLPGEVCMALGLCGVQSEEDMLKRSHPVTDETASSSSSALGAGTSTQIREQINPTCTLCLFIINKLEDMLPKNRTEDAIVKLMGDVCDLLPDRYEEQCDDFINKYGKQIIDFLLSSVAPHSICAMLHLCWFQDTSGTEMLAPSDCESCRTLAVLSRLHLGLNATEPQTSSFLQSVCLHHPRAVPKCEVFTKLYGSRLQKVLGNQMDVPDACERADLCDAVKQREPLGKGRCTLGPSYWCADSEVAQKCGNLAFCEKYMWN